MKARFSQLSVGLIIEAAVLAVGAHADEFGAWSHRVRLTFPGYTRSSSLTNYAALVTFGEGSPAGFSFNNTLPDGRDLRFSDATTGATLDHEIDGPWGSGTARVWVRLPVFSGSTAIYAHWGKPDATAPAYTSNGSVWTNLFKAVWHMQSGPSPADSARYPSNHEGTDAGTDGVAEAAKVGNGLRYNGLGRVDIQNNTELEGTGDATWMFWYYKRGTGGGGYGSLLGEGVNFNYGMRHINNTDPMAWRIGSTTAQVTTPSLANNAWHFLAFRYKNNDKANVWVGGANAVTGTVNVAVGLDLDRLIGMGSGDDRAPNGTLDEIRIARTRLPDNWLWATWKNTDAPASFVAFDTVEQAGAPIFGAVSVESVAPTQAEVSVALDDAGGEEASVYVVYQIGTDAGVGGAWASTNSLGDFAAGTVDATLPSLAAGQDYAFRFFATSEGVTGWSSAGSFSTYNAAPVWTGSGADNLWSTVANWQGGLGLAAGSAVVFTNADATATAGAANNVVDSSRTVRSLAYRSLTADTSTGHVTSIPSGTTLTVSEGLTVGGLDAAQTSAAVLGGGGSLRLTGGDLEVRNSNASGTARASLAASGLALFDADVANVRVGVGSRSRGTLTLSGTSNHVVATTVTVGDSAGFGTADSGATSLLELGTDNVLFADTLNIGRHRESGALRFASGVSGGRVTIRNRAGTGRANLSLGIHGVDSDGSVKGTLDLRGGIVDALLGTVIVGQSPNVGSFGGLGEGLLAFDAGTIDVTTLTLGRQTRGSASSPGGRGEAILTGTNALLIAGTIEIGDDDAANSWNAPGYLTISNGTVRATTIRHGDGSTGARVNWHRGTVGNKAGGNLAILNNLYLTFQLYGADVPHVLDIDGGCTGTVGKALSGTGDLHKTGEGMAWLNAANTFVGTTHVLEGTLGGSGSLSGNLSVEGGFLAPGAGGVGTFSVTGDVSFASAATLVVELGSAASHDILVVDGDVMLNGALDVRSVGGYEPAGVVEWPILQITGGVTGRFASRTLGYGLRVADGKMYLTYPAELRTVIVVR